MEGSSAKGTLKGAQEVGRPDGDGGKEESRQMCLVLLSREGD